MAGLPGFTWEDRIPKRQVLLELLQADDPTDDPTAHRAVAKSVGVKVDFMLFCPQAVALLLRWGDVGSVSTLCTPRVLAGWKSVAAAMKSGDAAWPSFFFETSFMRMFGLIVPLLLDDLEAISRLQVRTSHRPS